MTEHVIQNWYGNMYGSSDTALKTQIKYQRPAKIISQHNHPSSTAATTTTKWIEIFGNEFNYWLVDLMDQMLIVPLLKKLANTFLSNEQAKK